MNHLCQGEPQCQVIILRNKFPQLTHVLASLCSAYFQEYEKQRDNILKGFSAYVGILEWQDKN